jgi:dolichol-phosphate mannosyltransferase
MKKPLLSIIIPVYCNAPSLEKLHTEIGNVIRELAKLNYEIIFVNDGSKDKSLSVLKNIHHKDPSHTKIINLSRNFGSFNAILAGMSQAKGDAVMDLTADLQDDPRLIKQLTIQWLRGFKVVLAVRGSRVDGVWTNLLSNAFYKLMQTFALPDMPTGGFDIFLIDRQVVDLILSMDEKNSSLVGQILWAGFKRKLVPYNRRARREGESGWTTSKKIKYFTDSILNFSYFPIRLMSVAGILTAISSFLYLVIIVINKLFNNIPITGWSSLIVVVLFIGGIQMLMLGVIGEYLWRTNESTKKRPNYIIDEVI